MRFLFFGAGAIGTYIGGSLAQAGHDVAFLERPEIVEILRRDGLRLTIGGQASQIPVHCAYTSAADALRTSSPDLAVFALKSYDTAAAAEPLKPLKDRLPSVLCLQNGVENEAVLESVFGAGRVIAGTVTSAVGRDPTGGITLERKRGVGVAAGNDLSVPLVEALNQSGLNARLYFSARPMKWSKLLTNLIANASSAILGMTPREIFSDRRLFLLEREMLRECLRVMRAERIAVTDLPGTPVRLLALAVQRLPRLLAQPVLARAVGAGRGGKMPSFYLDLNSGRRKTEVKWLNGAVARTGARLGVDTPVNRILTETLVRLTDGREPIRDFLHHPEKLLSNFTG